MLRAACAALLLAVPVRHIAAAEPRSGCEPQLLAQVQLHVTPRGDVYVPATLGTQEIYLQLSIGTGLPVIRESALKVLGLEPKRISGNGNLTVSGRPITHFASLKGLKVGSFSLLDRAAPVIPEPGVDAPAMLDGRPIVGLMGSTLFRNTDAELYLAERRLSLYKPFRCVNRSPVYWEGEVVELPLRVDYAGALMFTLELDGKRIDTSLLTGESTSSIDANAARQFFGFDENSPGIEVVQSDAGRQRSVFHAMSLTGRGLQISDSKVRLNTGGTCKLKESATVYGSIGYDSCSNTVPFRLGTDLLAQMRIYISARRGKVYISKIEKDASAGGTITIAPLP